MHGTDELAQAIAPAPHCAESQPVSQLEAPCAHLAGVDASLQGLATVPSRAIRGACARARLHTHASTG